MLLASLHAAVCCLGEATKNKKNIKYLPQVSASVVQCLKENVSVKVACLP